MNKELLNKILPYCINLKAIYEEDISDVCVSSSETKRINAERLVEKSSDGTYHYKPILFPPNHLARKIETEHGKETPLIEMAKIAYKTIKARSSEIKNIKLICEKTIAYAELTNNYNVTYIFEYDINSGWFILMTNGLDITFNPISVLNYLYSRHIAFNLDPDKYVSVESLEKNPYAE